MRTDRILAVLLIAGSVAAASAAWLASPARKASLNLAGALGEGKADVALIDVYGTISDTADGGFFGSNEGASANRLIAAIREAETDGVKAILMRINSPGGTAAASQAVYEELMRVRKDGKIKIVASMGDVAASGGYYIAAAADHVTALPATTTGSIGVIMHLQNVEGLMHKLGINSTSVQSGPHKDILSPFRPTSPSERQILQTQVNETYNQFLNAIVAGRKMPIDKLRPLADGRIFTGSQAKQVGLVDSLGNWRVALGTTADMAGIKGEPTVEKYTGGDFWKGLVPKVEAKLPGFLQGVQSTEMPVKVPLALME
ncbi:putative signal peptide peptidase SppA [compost metagenome]